MPQLWCEPFYFLVLCLGIYYLARSRRVFSEAWNKRDLESFFQEQCGQELRRDIGRGLLRTLFGDLPLFSWLMMCSMLHQGGAGCLFWYTICMLLWLHPLGALAALWEYYRTPGEQQPDLGLLLERIRRRKGMEPRPRAVRGLHVLNANSRPNRQKKVYSTGWMTWFSAGTISAQRKSSPTASCSTSWQIPRIRAYTAA